MIGDKLRMKVKIIDCCRGENGMESVVVGEPMRTERSQILWTRGEGNAGRLVLFGAGKQQLREVKKTEKCKRTEKESRQCGYQRKKAET